MLMEDSMKDTGSKMFDMEKDTKGMFQGTYIEACFKMVRRMDEASMNGEMGKSMMENGLME